MLAILALKVDGQGLHDITESIRVHIKKSELAEGLCTLFIQHTSASLLIQENHDPSAKQDMQNWMNRLVPEQDSIYTHTLEGPDDMPAHIKAALTATSLSIPVMNGEPALGTWQGIFLWEHRHHSGTRKLVMHLV